MWFTKVILQSGFVVISRIIQKLPKGGLDCFKLVTVKGDAQSGLGASAWGLQKTISDSLAKN